MIQQYPFGPNYSTPLSSCPCSVGIIACSELRIRSCYMHGSPTSSCVVLCPCDDKAQLSGMDVQSHCMIMCVGCFSHSESVLVHNHNYATSCFKQNLLVLFELHACTCRLPALQTIQLYSKLVVSALLRHMS